jgi:hypothetical protein
MHKNRAGFMFMGYMQFYMGGLLSIRKLTGKHKCYIRVSATVMGETKQGHEIDKVEGAIRWVNFPL